MSVLTISEKVFLAYCAERGMAVERIQPQQSAGQFPDFLVTTKAGLVVVEVKELTPNKDERGFFEDSKKRNRISHRKLEIGTRLREKLKEASHQFKKYAETDMPELVVVYDNIQIDGHWIHLPETHFSSLDIAAAMFGVPQIVSVSGTERSFLHGGSQRMSSKRGRHLSALAILVDTRQSSEPRLKIFHNPFTSKPIHPCYFPDPRDNHYLKPELTHGSGWRWDKFTGDPTNCG